MSATPITDVCIFCGSRPGRNPEVVRAAETLGRLIAESGMRLVYGAGDVGVMGAVSAATRAAGGAVLGVIPEHLVGRETGASPSKSHVVTQTMHERKKVMFMNCDAIVALPGGPGTLDELFEVLTWRQLGLHQKPVILADIGGYWQPFLALIDHCIDEGFASPSFRDFITVRQTPEEVLAALRS